MLYVEGNSVLLYIFLYLVFRIQMTRINMCFLLSWESTSKVWYAVLLCNKHPLRRLCRAQSPLSGLQSLSQAWCPCLPPPLRRRCCAKRLRCAPQQATTLERSCPSIRRPRWFQRHVLKERKLNTVVELPDPKDIALVWRPGELQVLRYIWDTEAFWTIHFEVYILILLHWCCDWDLFLIHYDSHFRLKQYEARVRGLSAVQPMSWICNHGLRERFDIHSKFVFASNSIIDKHLTEHFFRSIQLMSV